MNVSITIHVAPKMDKNNDRHILNVLKPEFIRVTEHALRLGRRDRVTVELLHAAVARNQTDLFIYATDSYQGQRDKDQIDAWGQSLLGVVMEMKRNTVSKGYLLLVKKTIAVRIMHGKVYDYIPRQ